MYALYSLLTAAGMILLLPYFLVRGLIQGKYLSNIAERLGWRFPPELRDRNSPGSTEKSIWIHAVSVGEVLAVLPLAEQLKRRFPQRRLVVSTTTVTGQKIARERMPFADAIFYFPLDWRGPVRRALDAARPAAVIIVETEIWPNFLRECRRAEVPVIFVNGRLSERSFRGYGRALSYSAGALSGFLKKVLSDATLFLMQSDEDAARLIALGAPGERVLVTGNLKYDLAEAGESPLSSWLEAQVANSNRRPVVVAGSVLANEEVPVLRAFAEVEREFPRALLILAPRKPEQFDKAATIVAESGRKLLRRRDLNLNGAGKRRAIGTGQCVPARQSRRTWRIVSSCRRRVRRRLARSRRRAQYPGAGCIQQSSDLRSVDGKFPRNVGKISRGGRRDPGEEFGRTGRRVVGFASGTGTRRVAWGPARGNWWTEIAARRRVFWSTSSVS